MHVRLYFELFERDICINFKISISFFEFVLACRRIILYDVDSPLFALCYYAARRMKANVTQGVERQIGHVDGNSRSKPGIAFLEGCTTRRQSYSNMWLAERRLPGN